MTVSDPDEGGVYRLTYRSRSLIPQDERKKALGLLFSDARRRNKSRHVSGALLVDGDVFVQTLEGAEQDVRGLYERIERDPRHDDIVLVHSGRAAAPVFARWAMARVAEDGEQDIPLIAHADGIHAAAPRGDSTPAQEEVLAFMRETARRVHS